MIGDLKRLIDMLKVAKNPWQYGHSLINEGGRFRPRTDEEYPENDPQRWRYLAAQLNVIAGEVKGVAETARREAEQAQERLNSGQ